MSRIFYLLDDKKKFYYETKTEGVGKNSWFGGFKKKSFLSLSSSLLDQYLKKPNLLSKLIDTPTKKLFWKNADLLTKKAVVLSYHHYLSGRKIAGPLNIEIGNWLNSPFFKTYYQKKLSLTKMSFKNRWFKWLPHSIDLWGEHLKGVRFENIHLAQDIINGRLVSTVHYDKFYPGKSAFSLLQHYFQEVVGWSAD